MSIRYTHTNIIAEDWRRLVQFYEAVFECVFVPPQRDQSGEWLAKGTGVRNAALKGVHLKLPGFGNDGPTLEIFSYSQMEEKPPPAANRKGLGHLAFSVDNVQEIIEKIIENGGRSLGEIVVRDVAGVGQITFVYATDPEGNILEIQNWS
jgi:predicted enzyme related to lactoylglutathione lyase